MEHIKLAAQPRTVTGKAVKYLRKQGVVPAVVYGGLLRESLSVQMNERDLNRALAAAGAARVIDLQLDGVSVPVLTREVQRHVTRLHITHVDFLAVRLDQMIQADVQISLTGEAPAVEMQDAVLVQSVTTLTVEALPDNLPGHLEIDVTGLTEIGQSLTAGDITLPANVTLITPADTLIVAATAPARAEVALDGMEAAPADGGEAAETAADDE